MGRSKSGADGEGDRLANAAIDEFVWSDDEQCSRRGVTCLVYPLVASVAIIYPSGWVLIASGIGLIGAPPVPYFWLELISAALSTIVGLLLLCYPRSLLIMTAAARENLIAAACE